MARQVQLRRGTTAQHATFTGALGEVTVDTDKDVVVVHDGSTAGGFPLVTVDKLPLAGGTMTGDITFNTGQLFDGRDVSADGSKLDGIEVGADVTDTTNVTAAGALMDSEVTNLAQVKAFDSADYATAAQGSLADSAVQPNDSPTFGTTSVSTVDFGDWTITESGGSLYFAALGTNKMQLDADGNLDVVGNVNSNATIS